jgi:uncharacterized protein YidB (DUF937 family)
MTALLGLLAVAGYQNRDKIADMLRGAGAGQSGTGQPGTVQQGGGGGGGLGGLLGSLAGSLGGGSLGGGSLGGAGAGGLLSGGLGELINRFNQAGHGDTANSWVGTGANKPVSPDQLEDALGPDVLDTLTKHTGLSRDELLKRLSRELPEAVDKYTPQGRLPQLSDYPAR